VKSWAVVSFLAFVATTASFAQNPLFDEDEKERAFAAYSNGAWRGLAAAHHTGGLECIIATPGVRLSQLRPVESFQMPASWQFKLRPANEGDVRIDWVELDGDRYEVASLPWRRRDPAPVAEDEIIVMFESPMLSFRRNRSRQWLPLAYLTEDLFEARTLVVGYRLPDDEEPSRLYTRRFKLSGFSQVAKWCGRQLLSERQQEDRVRELTQ
jgi:hypothetical protein